jgi:hypothetical protein
LKEFVGIGEAKTPFSYDDAAKSLDAGVGTVKTWIYRLRSRYIEIVREEVARTVSDPAEINNEIHALCDALIASERGRREEILCTAEFDLVICIVWSQLGPLLDPTLRIPDGNSADSRTGYEIARASDRANKNLPAWHIFRNCSKPTPPLEPKEDREAFSRHWDSLQDFFCALGEERRGEVRLRTE